MADSDGNQDWTDYFPFIRIVAPRISDRVCFQSTCHAQRDYQLLFTNAQELAGPRQSSTRV